MYRNPWNLYALKVKQQKEKLRRGGISFTIAPKITKCLGTNLTKEIKDLPLKTVLH